MLPRVLLTFGGRADAGTHVSEALTDVYSDGYLLREWDVAAGICLLKEAGGLVTSANPPDDLDTATVADAHLGSRLYLAIRPAGKSATETGRQTQERTVREVWRRVQRLDYARPGT